MAAAPGLDPLRNIPKFLGDNTKDMLTAYQHIEAFEDYLCAYGLYRYDNIGPGAGQAAVQQARAREIVNRLGFSLQGKAKTQFHEKTLFVNPAVPAIADYDTLKQEFLIWFNPYSRTQKELNIEWENIKSNANTSIEAIWERIQTIGQGLGYNNNLLTEKLRMCLPPEVFGATVQINDAQQILDIARRIAAYRQSRSAPSTQAATTTPAACKPNTSQFMYIYNTHRPGIPRKLDTAKHLTKLESGLNILMHNRSCIPT